MVGRNVKILQQPLLFPHDSAEPQSQGLSIGELVDTAGRQQSTSRSLEWLSSNLMYQK